MSMTPASEIIERCGGFKAVADWLGLERTAVQRWTYSPPKGAGDRVPERHWPALIDAAARAGITVSADELMSPDMKRVVFNPPTVAAALDAAEGQGQAA